MRQMVLPLIVGAEATKRGLLAFVQQMGMLALRELFDGEAEMIAGPKGKHVPGRTHHHWGTTRTPLPFGGRHVVVERPRVRRKGGGEEMLPSVEAFREADPLSARVAEQIVLGVSTRGYGPQPGAWSPRSWRRAATSKSAASRALIDKTDREARRVPRASARRRGADRDVSRRHRVRRGDGDRRARRDDRWNEGAAGPVERLDREPRRRRGTACRICSIAVCASRSRCSS